MADKVAGLLFKISADTRALRQGLNQTKKSVTGVQKTMQMLGRTMVGVFGAHTIINAIRNVAKTFMDFEQSLANVRAISRASGDEFTRLSKLARDLGGSTAWTATQVAQLETEYAKLGFTTPQIEAAAEATLNLATAAGTELARAAEVAGGIIRAYGKDASETANVTDIMAHAFSSSALDMEKFANAMTYVGPVAAGANINLKESTALLSVLANNMIDGSMAGTSLKMIINELSQSGKPLAERLKELADKGLTLAEAEGEVGKRAQTALLVLAKNADLLPGLTAEYDKVAGSAKRMADIMLDTVEGELKLFKSALDEVKITLGEMATSSGDLKTGIEGLTTSLQTFTTFLKSDWLKTIRSASKAFMDFLVPTRILARNWDKIFPGDKWRNMTPESNAPHFGTDPAAAAAEAARKAAAAKAGSPIKMARFGIAGQENLMGGQANVMQGLFGMSGIGAGQFDLSGMISGVEQRASNLATTVRTTLAPAMAELGVVVQQVFAGAVEAFGSFVEQLASGNLDMSLQTILASFGGFIAQMGKMIAAYGFAALAMKAVLVNPVAAIAAGLAMVAIGSAIKGLASRGPAVGGGGGGAPGGGMAAIPITGTTKIQGRDIVIAYERGSSLTNSVT